MGEVSQQVNWQEWTLSTPSGPGDFPYCLLHLETVCLLEAVSWERAISHWPQTGSLHSPLTNPAPGECTENLPAWGIKGATLVTRGLTGQANPVSHSSRLQGKTPRQGPIQKEIKPWPRPRLSEKPVGLLWGREGNHLELRPLQMKLFSYSIIHSTIYT